MMLGAGSNGKPYDGVSMGPGLYPELDKSLSTLETNQWFMARGWDVYRVSNLVGTVTAMNKPFTNII